MNLLRSRGPGAVELPQNLPSDPLLIHIDSILRAVYVLRLVFANELNLVPCREACNDGKSHAHLGRVRTPSFQYEREMKTLEE